MEAKNVASGLEKISQIASESITNLQRKSAAGGGTQNELHSATYQLARGLRNNE